ncbi:DUF2345 domain-containing protein, partial [Rhodovulum sulfidophilum]|uniref:DUF2345 domain-containing protein n=1 Tax=Rhodovulum sulfidophilum TaxID=35806 RepID=UPI001EE3DD50
SARAGGPRGSSSMLRRRRSAPSPKLTRARQTDFARAATRSAYRSAEAVWKRAGRGFRMLVCQAVRSGGVHGQMHLAPLAAALNLRDQKHPRMNLGHARSVQRGSMLLHAAADMMISSDDEFQIQSDKSLRLASLDTLSVTTPADLKMSSQERVIVEASNGIVFNSESGIVLRSGKSRIRLSPSGKIEIDGSEVIVKGDKICLN